jgi:hypothetical protein
MKVIIGSPLSDAISETREKTPINAGFPQQSYRLASRIRFKGVTEIDSMSFTQDKKCPQQRERRSVETCGDLK